jgi:hypothetical protein
MNEWSAEVQGWLSMKCGFHRDTELISLSHNEQETHKKKKKESAPWHVI